MAKTAEAAETGTPDAWAMQLREAQLPILSDTVQKLCTAASDRNTSAPDLARVILQDAAMTSGVLKVANSAYYNATGQEINTISRAVVLLGFEPVRAIGLSFAVIDSLLEGDARSKALETMQQAVYAAVQAKQIAQNAGDRSPEEVFIAALLYRLGELAFWSFAKDDQAQAMREALAQPNVSPVEAEIQVLGFSMKQLTTVLARDWHLGERLETALKANPNKPDRRVASILLGHQLEAAIRTHGWDSAQAKDVAGKIGEFAKLNDKETSQLLEESRKQVAAAAKAFGISAPALGTAAAPTTAEASESSAATARPAQRAQQPAFQKPAPMLQLKILRELSNLLREKPDISVVLEMVIEGIYRGVGMDRTIVCSLSPDRKSLRVKYALGDADGDLQETFRTSLQEPSFTLVRHALKTQRGLWAGTLPAGEAASFNRDAMAQCVGGDDFFVAPLVVRKRDIGLIYADRIRSGRPLDEDSFNSFDHFVEQANLSLEYLMR